MSRSTLISLGMLVIGLFLALFLLVPEWQNINAEKEEKKKSENTLEEWNTYLANINDLSFKYEQSASDLEKLSLAIPSDSQMPELLIQLGEVVKRNGLIATDIKFTAKGETSQEQLKSPSKIKTIEMNLEAEGTYPNFKKFLNDMEKGARLTDVSSVSFAKGGESEGGDIMKFKMVLNSYYLVK